MDTLYELPAAWVDLPLSNELHDAATSDTATATRTQHARGAERKFTTVIDLSLIR
jgi:hypothetical protein